MANIFISHSSRNSDRAIEVRNWLAANGWDDVFLDLDPERGIVAGQRWKEALQKAAHRCEVVLALVSPEWIASSWCKSEIDAARLMGKKIIVALIGVDKGLVPLDLSDEQWIDLVNDPAAYTRLKEGLKRAGLDPSSFVLEPGRRPYPGFAFLEEKDAALFFGRDAQIVRGLDKMRGLVRTGVERMLVILGASGSGKSSFLRRVVAAAQARRPKLVAAAGNPAGARGDVRQVRACAGAAANGDTPAIRRSDSPVGSASQPYRHPGVHREDRRRAAANLRGAARHRASTGAGRRDGPAADHCYRHRSRRRAFQ